MRLGSPGISKRGELVIPRKLVGDVPCSRSTDRTTLLKGVESAKRLVRDLLINFDQSFCCEKGESMMRVPPPFSLLKLLQDIIWSVVVCWPEGKWVCVKNASSMVVSPKSALGCRGEREGGIEPGFFTRVCLRKSA